MSRAANLAGFSTSISPPSNLTVGVVTASGFVGNVTGNATGLSGSPNVTVGVITATTFSGNGANITGVVTATSFSGNGSGLTGVGIGTTGSVNTTGIGTFGTIVATNDLDIPSGTSAQRPVAPTAGSFRYNSDLGIVEFYNGITWLQVSSSSDDLGIRGVFGGGNPATNVLEYITIATTGNATDFGDLTVVGRVGLAACSSSTRGAFGAGYNPSPLSTSINTIDYITIATTGDATDFGDLTVARSSLAACSSSTRGVFGGAGNTIDYITIASVGNATDFGDLTVARGDVAGCSSNTRGVFGAGYVAPTYQNTIDYITIATTGNATDFGDLTVSRGNYYPGACSSSTRGVFGGGFSPAGATNTIDYITIATTGNATDFGDLTVARFGLASCSSKIRGVFGGGVGNTIDYITIATTGNATDFGDLIFLPGDRIAACSNGHGGLS